MGASRVVESVSPVLDLSDGGRLSNSKLQTLMTNLQDAEAAASNAVDSLSEMGETESLRLQMTMDRVAKLMSTLSNLLKKVSDIAASITQNIK